LPQATDLCSLPQEIQVEQDEVEVQDRALQKDKLRVERISEQLTEELEKHNAEVEDFAPEKTKRQVRTTCISKIDPSRRHFKFSLNAEPRSKEISSIGRVARPLHRESVRMLPLQSSARTSISL